MSRQGRRYRFSPEPKEARLGRNQRLPEDAEPAGMGKIPRPNHIDPLNPGPARQPSKVALAARRPRKSGMDMEISTIFPQGPPKRQLFCIYSIYSPLIINKPSHRIQLLLAHTGYLW